MSTNVTMALLGRHAPTIDRPTEADHAAEVRTVRTSEELADAFAQMAAGAGGVIELAAGVGPFRLWSGDFQLARVDAPVLIRSADPAEPAVIERLELVHRENVTFEDIRFEGTRQTANSAGDMVLIQRSENIAIFDSTFASNAEGPAGLQGGGAVGANALRFKATDGITVAGNRFEGVNHAFQVTNSDDVTFALNEVTAIQGDGVRLGGIEGARIEANWMHGLLGSTQGFNHSDMIQLWGTGNTQNNTDIRIASNLLDSSGGPAYQMIFGRNEERAKNGWLFEDLVVEDNVLVGGAWHRISVFDTKGMQIRDNTLLDAGTPYQLKADGGTQPLGTGWIDAPGGTATITGNVAAVIRGGAPGANVTAKADAQAAQTGIDITGGAPGGADLRDYLLDPGSAWNGKWGSSLLWNDGTSEGTMAIARHRIDAADRSVVHLDARLSRDADGLLDPGSATFTWTFADGTVRKGASVTHDFGTATGAQGYELRVTGPSGSDSVGRTVEIAPSAAIDLRIEKGRVVNAADPTMDLDAFEVEDGAIAIGPGATPALVRGTKGAHELTAFDMAMTLETAPGDKGVFLYLHKALRAEVTPEGALRFELTTEAGTFVARTEGGLMGGARDVNAVYDGKTLTLYVDGEAEAAVAATGTTPPAVHWGLTFGREWGGTIEGRLSNVLISQEPSSPEEVRARWDAVDGGAPAPATPPPAPQPVPMPMPMPAPAALLEMGFDDLDVAGAGGAGTARAIGGPAFAKADGRDVIDMDRGDLVMAEAGIDHAALGGFDLTVDLSYDDAASHKLLTFGRSLDMWTWKNSLFARLTTDEGTVTLRAITDAFSDEGFHSVGVGYDAAAERFALRIDGEIAAARDASGALRDHGGDDLLLGARGGTALDAMIDRIAVQEAAEWLSVA